MSRVSIRPYATWVQSIGLLGTYNSPLRLQVDIQNNTNERVTISEASLRVRVLFFFSKEIIHQQVNWPITSRGKFSFELDVARLANEYGNDKVFYIAVKDERGNWEQSEKVSLSAVQAIGSTL